MYINLIYHQKQPHSNSPPSFPHSFLIFYQWYHQHYISTNKDILFGSPGETSYWIMSIMNWSRSFYWSDSLFYSLSVFTFFPVKFYPACLLTLTKWLDFISGFHAYPFYTQFLPQQLIYLSFLPMWVSSYLMILQFLMVAIFSALTHCTLWDLWLISGAQSQFIYLALDRVLWAILIHNIN
mgnify:CR=1 FL=1